MPEDLGPGTLSHLLALQPVEIAQFISALASEEPWALGAIDARIDESPFDRIATYWVVAPHTVRMAIVRGLEQFLSAIGAHNRATLSGDDLDQLRQVLGFCIGIMPDLALEAAEPIVPYLVQWLNRGVQPHGKLAATALASTSSLEATAALEATAQRSAYPSWILPALIERRANADPLALFEFHEKWLPAATHDPRAFGTLGQGIERLIATSVGDAAAILSGVLDKHEGPVGNAVRTLLRELDLRMLPRIRAVLDGPVKLPAWQLLRDLDNIRLDADDDEVNREWHQVYDRIVRASGDVDSAWRYVCVRSAEMATEEIGQRFLHTLRSSILSSPIQHPNFRPAELLRRAQREFYLAKIDAQQGGNAADEKVLFQRLNGRVKVKSTPSDVPRELRIPTVYYAEEAYLEVLSLLIRASFSHASHFRVYRAPHIPWHRLLFSLQEGHVDLGLNNDDIFKHESSTRGGGIVRLAGEPLYSIDAFTVLTRRRFLLENGLDSLSVNRAWANQANLLAGDLSTAHDALFARLIEAGRISVPGGTFLEPAIKAIAERHGIASTFVSGEDSDKGLADFLNGDVSLYFGGRLQTNFVFASCRDIVRLGELQVPIHGRLFATANFADAHGQFMSDLAAIAGELNYALNEVSDRSYRSALERVLPLRLNEAVLKGSEEAIATVESYRDLHAALAQGTLARSAKARQWQAWEPTDGVVPLSQIGSASRMDGGAA
ncbi:MAG TPA: hypothetical protein VFG23_04500 [Polyangia bacterium]|nr:hypothetical protein [Polyangia bacterium]